MWAYGLYSEINMMTKVNSLANLQTSVHLHHMMILTSSPSGNVDTSLQHLIQSVQGAWGDSHYHKVPGGIAVITILPGGIAVITILPGGIAVITILQGAWGDSHYHKVPGGIAIITRCLGG